MRTFSVEIRKSFFTTQSEVLDTMKKYMRKTRDNVQKSEMGNFLIMFIMDSGDKWSPYPDPQTANRKSQTTNLLL